MLRTRASRLVLLSVVGAAVLPAAGAPAASAAQRYAGPSGAGTDCSAIEPCTITQAITGAAAGDEVIVNPGDYTLNNALYPPYQTTIHGVAGQPRPRLLFNSNSDDLYIQHGTTVRYVEVHQAGSGIALEASSSSVVDQVVLTSAGPGFATAVIDNSTISNSVVVASGTDGRAIKTSAYAVNSNGTYRNVTAIATGSGGVAIHAEAALKGKATVNAINVIARGAGWGLKAQTDSSGAETTINVTHSNLSSEIPIGTNALLSSGGGNQVSPPAFANAATGDYRQTAASPTIGAGLDDPANGAFDVEGDPRQVGTTDIGADEFVAAPTNTDTPPPPASSSPTPLPTPVTFAGVKLISTRLSFGGRFITLRLSCPAGTVGGCSGRTKLTARRRALGRASFSIGAGRQGKVRVRASRAGRRLLRRADRLRAKDTNTARDGAGVSKTTAAAVTIRNRRR